MSQPSNPPKEGREHDRLIAVDHPGFYLGGPELQVTWLGSDREEVMEYMRLSLNQVRQLNARMIEEEIDEIDLSEGSDGRLVLKQVEKKEVLKPFPMVKREKGNGGGENQQAQPLASV